MEQRGSAGVPCECRAADADGSTSLWHSAAELLKVAGADELIEDFLAARVGEMEGSSDEEEQTEVQGRVAGHGRGTQR